jgi:RimJ/RimL family protein N-acetyltransferase
MTDIFLRELDRSDVSRLNAWRADRALVALLGGTFRYIGSEVDERWFDQYLSSRANNVRLAICRQEDRQLVGAVYLLNIDWVNRSAEFSIQIGEREAQGRGIGKAATRLAIKHAFDDLNLYRVHLTALATNEQALALYRTVGFHQEGVFRQAAWKEGAFVDVISMAMLASDRGEEI